MQVIQSVGQMQQFSENMRTQGKKIAFVPTMGFLHEGHLSLIDYGRKNADVLIISVFVNPTQFGEGEDFQEYPRDLVRDCEIARKARVDVVFVPEVLEMYPKDFQTYVTVESLSQPLCGAFRPGHFRGVTTVVAKLFNIVKPHIAIFGKKDFQQWVIIRKMVKDLNLDIEVIGLPTVREHDGLAMSSRNSYLTKEERDSALSLYQSLNMAKDMVASGERNVSQIVCKIKDFILSKPYTKIEYVKICSPDTLEDMETLEDKALLAMAVKIGKTRLIDNTLLEVAKEKANATDHVKIQNP
ncbi:MAG TPA: pantoate--beta-alanine ligase [Syntrophaceae bacterium]|nr:pantoate--beta-alanine ligase [Syntrophaceae bacterium]